MHVRRHHRYFFFFFSSRRLVSVCALQISILAPPVHPSVRLFRRAPHFQKNHLSTFSSRLKVAFFFFNFSIFVFISCKKKEEEEEDGQLYTFAHIFPKYIKKKKPPVRALWTGPNAA
jgi:hypothetical protein